jgi:hypothetical protein
VIAADDDRGPKSGEFVHPGVGAFLHLDMEMMLEGVEEADREGFVESAHEQGVSGVIMPVVTGLELDICFRVVHRNTSDG